MPIKTSPLAIIKQSASTGLNVLGRIQKTASVAGLSALRVAKGEKMDANLLKDAFEQMGVTYIKLGQFIASTPSIFPREYVLAFQDCLDQTTPVPFTEILAILREELGTTCDLDEIFEYIDPNPLASASIAQVHRAVLTDGRQVALKVQKPKVGTIIHTDLTVLHGGFWVIEKMMPVMRTANIAPILDEIRKRMLMEIDFIAESRHIERFLAFLSRTGNAKVTAPTVHHHLSTRRVLTMDLLVGRSLVDETLGLAKDTTKAQKVMSDVLDTWFLSLMTTGEFHADLHAGNLMMLDDGRIAFLDFGLVGQIEPKSLEACFTLVQNLQASDYHGMAQAMAQIGMTHQKVDVTKLGEDLHGMLGKVGQDNQPEALNTMMLEMADVGKKHGIHFPQDFALLLKQLLYFDRFMVTLAPEMELFEGERLKVISAN
ncbi:MULTISPECIES: ABC1 kinase family protein [unclassified Moraxella]|uniref:ABC1 kinase family protein n=1 Tax=unclassified Moraxella TaxID=2685852 RepID=UPI00359CE324